ncbi:hypothetical protein B0H16DRAFT_513855 [Mycena metata]|uniref:NAD(P)-binding protein n=1 Tax=Mycena metata TaxID=1033252 RepID=A0AAD7H8T7_9AGAR|nr:hypothetical protein B0H16DRAFT_513855 [Mycena metata]
MSPTAMPPNFAAALTKVSLVGQNKTAVVVGGTLGIGAAVARLLAKLGCKRIIILGRDENRGTAMLETMKKLAPADSRLEVAFVWGDLSDTKGMRAAALALREAAGPAGIDYLIMTQNGVPKGFLVPNADGHDTGFAIQALSRVALSYLLTKQGGLAPNAILMSIANQGNSLDDLSVDDLSLKVRAAAGESQTALFMNQSKRDSTVLDSFIEEFNTRYPAYRFFHLWPGLVNTENFTYDEVPGYIKYMMWLGMQLIGTTPDKYAPLPVYILTSPDATQTLGSGMYFDYKLNPGKLGKWAGDVKNRKALWPVLMEIIGEGGSE